MLFPRHELPEFNAVAQRAFLDQVAGCREQIALHPGVLLDLIDGIPRLLGNAEDHADSEIQRAVAVAAQAAAALFKIVTTKTSVSTTIRIGPNRMEVPVVDLSLDATTTRWWIGFCCALLVRDQRTLSDLQAVPIEQIHEYSETEGERLLIEGIHDWGFGGSTWQARFQEARAAIRERIGGARLRGEALLLPWIRLAETLDTEPAALTTVLIEALTAHRDYWSERKNDPQGGISLPLLALCCIAQQRGLDLDVQSDYLPRAWRYLRRNLPERSVSNKYLENEVLPFLRALLEPGRAAVIASWKPRIEDYAQVFVPEAAAQFQAFYERLWQKLPHFSIDPRQTAIDIVPSPAVALAHHTEFPDGYRQIARLLQPDLLWIAWRYREPNATSGMSFDGLVWVDDHWAWFPKPWRVLGRQ